MSKKKRPSSDKDLLARQAAALRRGAPGAKRFVGGAQEQRERARHETLERVHRMVEVDAARREGEAPLPLAAVLAELVEDAARLARTLASAPFRLAGAFLGVWRPREA